MSKYLGNYVAGSTVRFLWSTFTRLGASVTRSTDGTVMVYKDANATQVTDGITDTENFDGVIGQHLCQIDTSANPNFYAAGSDFHVALRSAVIDGRAVNASLAEFAIQNRHGTATYTLPISVAVSSSGAVTELDLLAYQFAAFSYAFTVVDANSAAVDLSGKTLSFIIYRRADESKVFELTTGGGQISVGGAGNNVVTVAGADTRTQTAATYGYVLRNQTDDDVLVRGTLTIREVPDAA